VSKPFGLVYLSEWVVAVDEVVFVSRSSTERSNGR